jgi:putative addiction module CopG family antidote
MLTLSFPSDIQEFLHEEVATGRYRSEEELVVEAIRRFREGNLRFQELRANVQEGLESLDRGDAIEIEGDEALGLFFDEIEAEVQASPS